jgi:hypothetical protein
MHHHQSCIIEELHEPVAPASNSNTSPNSVPESGAVSSSTAGPGQQQEGSDLPQPSAAVADADANVGAGQGREADAATSSGTQNDASASSSAAEQPALTPEQEQLLDDCERLKQEGNAAYAREEYDEALQLYWQVTSPCYE